MYKYLNRLSEGMCNSETVYIFSLRLVTYSISFCGEYSLVTLLFSFLIVFIVQIMSSVLCIM